jgi:transcriptional regulator with XRE-family HTH domain
VPRRPKRPPRLAPVDEKVIGERLRILRQRQGLTQEKVAAKLGVRQGLVSAYERGESRVHAALLAAFAKALKATPNEILGFEKAHVNGSGDQRFLRRLAQIEKLSRRDKLALLRTIDRYVKDVKGPVDARS